MVCMGNCTIELILNLMSRMHSGQELFENKPQFQRSHKFAKAIETSKKAQQLIGCWALESFLLWTLLTRRLRRSLRQDTPPWLPDIEWIRHRFQVVCRQKSILRLPHV